MTAVATLSDKFRISISKAVREDQHWVAGQEFLFIPKGSGVLLTPVPRFDELAGLVKHAKSRVIRDRADRY